MSTVAFLGGGRITSALAAGLRLVGEDREIVVYDRHPEKLKALRHNSHVKVAPDLKSAVERARMLVIAVRPTSVRGMLEEVTASGARVPRLCVSLAAGIPLRSLRTWLPEAHWARAMPSPVCRVARGLTALCFDRGVTKREAGSVRDLFSRVGELAEIPERAFDAFTAIYSSSFGYHALAVLARAAQRAGLDSKTSLTAAAHALADGIRYWRESGQNLDDLLCEAATPGGTAAATMSAMDAAGFEQAVARGIAAGMRVARTNAKGPNEK